MKKLSDYKGEDAILLWGRLLDNFTVLLKNEEIKNCFISKKPTLYTAKVMLNKCPKDVMNMLTTIDDSPIDGLNVLVRLVSLLNEIGMDPTLQAFFGLSAEDKKEEIPIGSATESTEDTGTSNTSSDM